MRCVGATIEGVTVALMDGHRETPAETSFGARLRTLRLARGMSQAALSRLVHYSKGYLSKIESGVKPATVDLARRCDDALGAGGELATLLLTMPAPPKRVRKHARPAQLPRSVAGFVGRQSQLDQLDACLNAKDRGTPIIVISGPAGVGKTALAVRWARRIIGAFPDGALFTDLRGYGPATPVGPPEVIDRFLRALGVPPEAVPPDAAGRVALLRSETDGARLLMVLDNASDPEQVRPLLPGSAWCVVLVTSRSRMSGLVVREGALRLDLEPLPEADAVELLCGMVGDERAGAERDSAVEVAQHCGYLPLALRIAGERAASRRWLSLRDLVDQLRVERDRLDLLDARDDPAAAMRPALSWSYRALSPDSARALRLLGLPTGPDISVAAASALVGADQRVTRKLLDGLCDANLLEEVRPERYQLHDLLRLYARERALADEPDHSREAARRRLLAWYLHSVAAADRHLVPQRHVTDLGPPPEGCHPLTFTGYAGALSWCTTERANLVAAVDCAAEHGADEIAWRLAAELSVFFMLSKHWHDWTATHRIGLDCARRAAAPDGVARLLSGLGAALGDIGRTEEAIECLEQALAVRQELGDRPNAARTMLNLGTAYSNLSRADLSIQWFRQALAVFRDVGEAYGEGMVLNNLGDVYLTLERLGDARDHLNQALAVFQAGGNRFGEGMVLSNLGVMYHRWRQLERAETCLRQAATIRRETGNRHGEASSLHRLGDVLADAGRPDEARESWTTALAIFDELASPEADEVRQRLGLTASP